eukprot:m51a1_g11286 putative p2x receptor (291) ;mRNA; r:30589-31959
MGRLGDLVDDLLSYETVHVVRIRDKRLAVLHYLCMLSVLLYIGLYTIFWQKRYLLLEQPSGTVRVNALKPASYVPMAELPYCSQSAGANRSGWVHECTLWDEAMAVYPTGQDSEFTLTTRATTSRQALDGCELTEDNCSFVPQARDVVNFVADVEHFTLLIDHSFFAHQVGIQANARDIVGVLRDCHGKEMKVSGPNQIGVKGEYDILEVQKILEAAGISTFDQISTASPGNVSMRYDGIVVMISIEYSNTHTWNTNKLRYTYTAKLIEDTKYKLLQPVHFFSLWCLVLD